MKFAKEAKAMRREKDKEEEADHEEEEQDRIAEENDHVDMSHKITTRQNHNKTTSIHSQPTIREKGENRSKQSRVSRH
jgi:hypothetical protein